MRTDRDIYAITILTHDGEKCTIDGVGDPVESIKLDRKTNCWIVKTENHDYLFDKNATRSIDIEYEEDY